ncbi:MAG: hypothetical protein GXY36_06135 [Chloroflexi bacterium]|nr:hypothetical protein [Chloroflexota bacterium]
MKQHVSQSLFILLIALLCLLPGYLFSRLYVTDGFLYQIIAYVQLSSPHDHLEIFTRGNYSFGFVEFLPGYPMTLSLYARMTGMAAPQVHFVPIAAVFLPLSYFVLARGLFQSTVIAGLFALYGVFDIGQASHYNMFAYTWSNLLYIGFLVFLLRAARYRQGADILMLFLLFAGSLFMHYAATMWMVVGTFSLNLLLLFGSGRLQRWIGQGLSRRGSLAMPGAFLIAFLTFNQLFYRVWLPSAAQLAAKGSTPFELFTAKLGTYLGFSAEAPEPFLYLNPWSEDLGLVRVLEYLIILLPVGVLLAHIALNYLRGRSLAVTDSNVKIMLLVAIPTGLAHWFIYGTHSGFNLRYVTLIFPFLMLMALRELKTPRWLQHAALGALTALAIVSFALALQYYQRLPPTSYGELKPSAGWFFRHRLSPEVLSDLDTAGVYLVNGSLITGDYPQFIPYDSDLYGSLINQPQSADDIPCYDYVVIDAGMLEKPLHGRSNRIYEPLSLHLTDLLENRHLTRIYDDGYAWLVVNRCEDR